MFLSNIRIMPYKKYIQILEFLHSNKIRYGQELVIFTQEGSIRGIYQNIDDSSLYVLNNPPIGLNSIIRIDIP